MEVPFSEKVLRVVSLIPKGETRTYADVARLSGSPRASRAVGNILKKNKNVDIPCHRVICSRGSAGKYNGLRGADKELILKKEGVILRS